MTVVIVRYGTGLTSISLLEKSSEGKRERMMVQRHSLDRSIRLLRAIQFNSIQYILQVQADLAFSSISSTYRHALATEIHDAHQCQPSQATSLNPSVVAPPPVDHPLSGTPFAIGFRRSTHVQLATGR